jgi:UDP:flavonoid glycosyltransferase YjiC (YdhE family)
VAELGMGVHLDPADVTATSLADAIATVEGDPSYRAAAEQMAKECAAAGGAAEAADVMELPLTR